MEHSELWQQLWLGGDLCQQASLEKLQFHFHPVPDLRKDNKKPNNNKNELC